MLVFADSLGKKVLIGVLIAGHRWDTRFRWEAVLRPLLTRAWLKVLRRMRGKRNSQDLELALAYLTHVRDGVPPGSPKGPAQPQVRSARRSVKTFLSLSAPTSLTDLESMSRWSGSGQTRRAETS